MFPRNAQLSVRVILLPGISLCCQHPGIFFQGVLIFFQGGFFPQKCTNPTPLLQSWRRTFPALQKAVTTHPCFYWQSLQDESIALILETFKLPVLVALTPSFILIPTHTIFLFACFIFLFFFFNFNRGMSPGSSECWRMEQHPHSKLYQHGWCLTQRDETQEPFPQS